MRRHAVVVVLAFVTPALHAQEAEPQAPNEDGFKLTAGAYRYSDASRAADVNLQNASRLGNTWLGYFQWPSQGVHQGRAGWENEFGEAVRIQPSVQAATGGFVGASVQAEVGDPWFVAVGFGRTNLRPYYNLNFDPNDSYSVQAGYKDEAAGRLVSALLVRDNREHPDQRHIHLTWRESLGDGHRVTLDALHKVGTLDDETKIHRWGFTAIYSWPRFFVLASYDPKTNFTPLDLWRVAIGTRF